MKRFTVASISCIAALAMPVASLRSAVAAKPFTPIVKNVPGGIVMTGQDTGAPLPSQSPSLKNIDREFDSFQIDCYECLHDDAKIGQSWF